MPINPRAPPAAAAAAGLPASSRLIEPLWKTASLTTA